MEIKNTQSKLARIAERISKTPQEYQEFRFRIVQRVFIVVAAGYFVVQLFTIWGFYFSFLPLGFLSALTFHLYSLVLITSVWFAFAFTEKFIAHTFPNQWWITYAVALLFSIFVGFSLFIHIAPSFS